MPQNSMYSNIATPLLNPNPPLLTPTLLFLTLQLKLAACFIENGFPSRALILNTYILDLANKNAVFLAAL